MATEIPYFVAMSKVVAASGQDNLQFTVPANQRFYASQMRWDSTGTFDLIDIQTQESIHYGNLSATNPIPSKFLQDPDNAFLALKDLQPEIDVKAQATVSFVVKDTSALPNTIRLILAGRMEVP